MNSILQVKKIFHSVLVTLCFLGSLSSGEESPFVLYSVDGEETQQPLKLLNESQTWTETQQGYRVRNLHPTNDPYREPSWEFAVMPSFPDHWTSLVLEVEFLDLGAGVIEVHLLNDDRFNGKWDIASRQVSYTRLNTGQIRRALFEWRNIDVQALKSATKPAIRITGLQHLRGFRAFSSLSEQSWQEAKNKVPIDVQPMVQLNRPMDIVCSAGVAVLADDSALESSLEALHELAPLAKVLGFNAVESYVKWNLIESELGKFDFSFYDAVVAKLQQYDLQWFPLLIVGSAYALPDWFAESEENVGFVCLEHGISNPIQSIWSPYHKKHVTRVLQAFGKHYEPMKVLRGVRLGPSGNYGESQYPAGGNWGYKGNPMHIHIGFWANDLYAHRDFQRYLTEKYRTIDALNRAWDSDYRSIAEIKTFLPMMCYSKRKTLDMAQWYTESMSQWCDWWVMEARQAMPQTPIYQSAGGWGFLEAGTDYAAQAKSMTKIRGGIRLTNETDSYEQNFFATRLAATAARLYGIDLGYEPASSHTARGTTGRLLNTVATNGDHFFTYFSNIFNQEMAIRRWLEHYALFDFRQDPIIDVAVYYPETMNQLDPGTFRYLYAWGFNPRAREVRRHIEVDYLNEILIREGFLNRYKVLVFAWGSIVERDVEEAIDAWVRKGGVVFYPSFPKGGLETVEGDSSIYKRWEKGDTGDGAFFRFEGDMEPPSLYGDFVRDRLLEMNDLHPLTRKVLRIECPDRVFFSIQEDGHILGLNYNDTLAEVRLPDGRIISIESYSAVRFTME